MSIQSRFLTTSCLIAITSIFVGCQSTSTRNNPANGATQGVVVQESVFAKGATMRVDGLGCPMCAESISILLGNIDAVNDSQVDLSTGIVHVDLDPTIRVNESELRGAIVDGGFTFRSISFEK